eukprot:CAMPEP_0172324890 /NCGR_PEP_ID=MMETSP1058-20130122/52575_1 /TAXON_ID=83371 /ORGANISM="Detonula confervacea, Strain CCMP 353" /LENGTH=132 /DNA_ID=CAMNT_0013041303 /DNA_START=127 /DNA_END=525 /DNA_ORIENTATION=+
MNNSFLFVLSFLAVAANVSGFVSPLARGSKTSLSMVMDAPPAVSSVIVSFDQQSPITTSSSLNDGIGRFIAQEPSTILSSTNVLSLKDRPPPPTAEEIAQKKLNFNLWFWGGGFVAPFLATFYYFGLKFWER